MRRWRHLLIRRGRFSAPVPPQGNQGTARPSVTAQAGPHPRFPAVRLPRTRLAQPPRAAQAASWPSFTARPGPRPPWLPPSRAVRSRRADPGWGQGTAGQPHPGFTASPGSRPRWLPPARIQHARRADPAWPQGPAGQPLPAVAAIRARQVPRTARGRQAAPVSAPAVPWPSWAAQPGTHPRWATGARTFRARRSDPAWAQGAASPPVASRPGPRPRWLPAPRGRQITPPWTLQPPPVLPREIRQAGPSPHAAGRHLPPGRRTSQPPWPQAAQGTAVTGCGHPAPHRVPRIIRGCAQGLPQPPPPSPPPQAPGRTARPVPARPSPRRPASPLPPPAAPPARSTTRRPQPPPARRGRATGVLYPVPPPPAPSGPLYVSIARAYPVRVEIGGPGLTVTITQASPVTVAIAPQGDPGPGRVLYPGAPVTLSPCPGAVLCPPADLALQPA
jgi:hypothetical protein